MNVLVLLFFVTHATVISGKLTVLKWREDTGRRKLMCVSEDDGGGLIWNSNLNRTYISNSFSDRTENTGFQFLNAYQKGEIDCDLNSRDSCMSIWNVTYWTLTDSKKTPMGPVFDRRWEDFTEHNNIKNEYHFIDKLKKSGSFVISIRGSTDAHILLCDGENYKTNFCYWIIIGGWSNQISMIRQCAKGVPNPDDYPIEPMCEAKDSHDHKPLSPIEWRTFILTRDETKNTIAVYDTEKQFLMYEYDDEQSRNQSSYYSLFLRSSVNMRFRFHIYNFLYTTDSQAALKSPVLHLHTTNLCIEMIIGLCAKCQMEIAVIDPSNKINEETLQTIKQSTTGAAHDLPTWQYIRINQTILSDFGKTVKVKLIPVLEQQSFDPLWAVANVRVCPPVGTLRYNTMDSYDYLWSNETCQKLSYNESIVVNSVHDAKINLEFDDSDCPEGTVGPYCSINCYSHLKTINCTATVICDVRGCTCPAGYLGTDCNNSCFIGWYGYGCRKTCGRCNFNTCNFMSGYCKFGCDNSKQYYIPPFCRTAIDTLPPPDIEFVNETIIQVILPVKNEYKLIPTSYQFAIWKEGETNSSLIGNYMKIFNNSTTMIGYTNDLEPGTSYKISCTLYVNNGSVSISGEWKSFTTRCTSTTNFKIEITNTSLILNKDQKVEVLYSCPDKWYELAFENSESGEIEKGNLIKLPYEFTKLKPYTFYKITISKGTAILFSQKVRSPEAAPSNVRNVTKVLVSNEEIILTWKPPLYPNGLIRKYEIKLQVQTYFGCDHLKIKPPENGSAPPIYTLFTRITISNLIPYAHYIVKIAAHTSYRGPNKKIEFSTNQTETPTAVYSNLRLQNYTLTWDPPKDCTTISGPIIAKIVITGISKMVANYSITRQTRKYSLDLNTLLHGAETYKARIYAIRDYFKEHNQFRYTELEFITPPKAPPSVKNLVIYEMDSKANNVHLRWLEPEPPINRQIQYYIVSSCQIISRCQIISKIPSTEYCKLWNNYVCATIKQLHQTAKLITVSAVSSIPGNISSVLIPKFEIKPHAPEMFIFETLEKGMVNLTWSHPWITGGRLQKFLINVKMISSRLRKLIRQSQKGMIYEYEIKEYQIRYNEILHLLSSSAYKISIQAVTYTGTIGNKNTTEVQTPLAIAFEKELTMEVRDADSTILLHIPAVLNDTKNSITKVIVKGPHACENYTKLNAYLNEKADIHYYEIAWIAATFSTNKYAGKTLTIGDNKIYGGATNCPLKSTEPYVVIVIVLIEEERIDSKFIITKTTSIRIGEVPNRHHEAWLIPITILVIAGFVIFYFYRRRKRRSLEEVILQEKMTLSRNTESLEIKSNPSSSKHTLTATPTSTDKEFLSRGSTPYDDGIIHTNDTNQREERMSLVKVKDFEDYVKQAIDSGLLDKQYATLPRGQTKPWEYGKLPQNKPKNRYGNLLAYDENRVILEKLPDDPYSDYINANYIKGYKKEKFYIATQGPKANTIIDFWRMIWQEQSCIICMVTNLVEGGKTKCEQYWPDIGKKKKYGDITVFSAKQIVLADFTFRTFHLSNEDEARKIEHLHYTAWPDHGVPLFAHSMVTYLKKLLATPPRNGPIVVHCSAGIGRTGTMILCDICLRRAAAEGTVDVFYETEMIRSQRANMVDNKQQYLLAHLALVECLLSIPTSLPCNESLPNKIKEFKTQLEIQQDSLEKMIWQDEALRAPINQTSLSERNLAKNRFPELVSAKVNRVYLKRYPPTDEDSDYISAVYVDGVRLQNQYLATQLPLPETFSDFWRMVAEYKVELIILLQPPDLEDTTCCPIIPSGEFKPVPYIHIRTKEFIEFEYHTSQKLILVNNSEKPVTEQQITILCSTEWKAGKNQDPPATTSLVALWQAAEKISRGDGPAVVLCHDGVTGCGLYLALSFLLERMTIERECDVCLAIRAVRRSRPDFVKPLEQIEYLYDAAVTYLKYFETYANFT